MHLRRRGLPPAAKFNPFDLRLAAAAVGLSCSALLLLNFLL